MDLGDSFDYCVFTTCNPLGNFICALSNVTGVISVLINDTSFACQSVPSVWPFIWLYSLFWPVCLRTNGHLGMMAVGQEGLVGSWRRRPSGEGAAVMAASTPNTPGAQGRHVDPAPENVLQRGLVLSWARSEA